MKSNSNALCIFCISICKTFWTPLVYNLFALIGRKAPFSLSLSL